MWAFAGLLSALFLGIYDIFKKTSLNGNAVMPVLFFSTLTSTALFLPVVIGSGLFPDKFTAIGLFAPSLTLTEHLQIILKSAIVVSSWILAFFAMKHLPVTIFAPIRSTGPLWTLAGALLIFQERLNGLQWVGVLLTLIFFYLFSTAGKLEGIEFRKNKWIYLIIGATILGSISGLYDKFIISRIDRIAVQAWFSFYQVIILFPVLAVFWFPNRKNTTKFRWRWTIPLIGVTLVVADFLYFYALSLEGSMISMISALRRSSVLITFTLGALLFKEQNLKRKGSYLIGILAGILLITLGSR
ncbi:EamA family transporter [Maribellus comscasis]|uniref:EamA family transporter n=1 Tax=Maribellus comscasis TaxID=2681766 RepID=A0A6I6K0T3_9BACT|nr:EamA family transporter [Maribellus comscasis]QGY46022.1 EamA family transporter [Maribellus comscasis]